MNEAREFDIWRCAECFEKHLRLTFRQIDGCDPGHYFAVCPRSRRRISIGLVSVDATTARGNG